MPDQTAATSVAEDSVSLTRVLSRGVARVAIATALLSGLLPQFGGGQTRAGARPTIGLALGGGSARGFAHVGVIRWFEDHHVPIDLVAGTSMGGLVGGAFAAGMSSSELGELLANTDWDEMFGASAYRYKSVQRKEDARAYPSRLEFHLRHGLALPTALNNGQRVDLLLARIGAIYAGCSSFDALPTPFRTVALDLRTAGPVVLDSGSLPRAMRATMSLPGIFPPVHIGDRVLVDGGPVNNLPSDVVRKMGADVVIAVDVTSAADTAQVTYSVFGLLNNTMDAMTRANTRRGRTRADIVIAPRLTMFGSFDWRRAAELADAGYQATDSLRDQLLRYAVDDNQWRRYLAYRAERRRIQNPLITALEIRGAVPADERMIRRRLQRQIGTRLDVTRVERSLIRLSGLDRYESVYWDLTNGRNGYALVVYAEPRRNAPPLMMSTLNIQNRTSDDFIFQLAARFLAYDNPSPRDELRVDASLGTASSLAAELRRPLGSSPFFVSVLGAAGTRRVTFARGDAIVAQYKESRVFAELDVGANPIRLMEMRLGVRTGYYDGHVKIGNPGLPSLKGSETQFGFRTIYDAQDSPVVPSGGLRLVGSARYVVNGPSPPASLDIIRTNDHLTQADLDASQVWSWSERANRVFVAGGIGSSFGDNPLPTDQFELGVPFRLDAFSPGERRGDHYGALSAGYLRVIGKLPEFLGGPILVGGWLETGDAFDDWSDASLLVQAGAGIVGETLIGPGMIGYSFGGGERRFYLGFGRIFR